jgi:hypothetical protein
MAKIDKITYMNNNTEYELSTFNPWNAWTTDDVLTKTASGYEWSTPTEPTVVSDDSWVTYHITVSNSDPASWTASNIITLVP